MNEPISTCPIYTKDLEIIKEFKERKNIKTLRDALRVAIEYANSHGAFK